VDPLTLLLVVVFFVLPLLQQMAEKRRKRGPRLPPLELPDEASRREAPRVRLERGEGGWSVDWGAWPTEAQDAPAEREESPYEDPYGAGYEMLPARIEAQPREVTVAEPAASPAPILRDRASRAVSLESLEVDRATEHARLHRRISEPVTPRRPAPTSLGRRLLVPSEARRALLLAEVLGPPRSLRPPDA
jgi:hypothetical protein